MEVLRQSPIARCLGLLAIALLLLRVGEAHLHLCFDGQDRSAAVHVDDAPTHDGTVDSASGHNDLDVDLSMQPWLKATGSDDPAALLSPLVLAALLLAALLAVLRSTIPAAISLQPVFAPITRLLPPRRGPPR